MQLKGQGEQGRIKQNLRRFRRAIRKEAQLTAGSSDDLRRQEQEWITHLTTFNYSFTFQFGIWACVILM